MTDSDPFGSKSFPENALDAAVTEVLGKDNPHAYSTITFIQRCLMQYNLATRLEPHEILNEAYVRGKKFIQSGKIIRNPHSWLKSTSLNIIREVSRKLQKEQPITPELLELIPYLNSVADTIFAMEDINDKWKALLSSFEILSRTNPEGARLLRLKAEGLSWLEIRLRLIQEGNEVNSESTLRQKGCRAKKQLRKIYHAKTTDAAELKIL